MGVDAEWRAVMEYANKRPHANSSSSPSSNNNNNNTSTRGITAASTPSNAASRGASILQIATPHCVLIFDLNTLSQTAAAVTSVNASEPGLGLGSEIGIAPGPGLDSASDPGLVESSDNVCDQAVHLLQSLFSREDVIKVGVIE